MFRVRLHRGGSLRLLEIEFAREFALNGTREGASTGHRHLEPGQQITRLESLHAFTRNGATVRQWPEIGRLAPGAPADVVIVDRDPISCSSQELAETGVLRTLLDGAGVYDSGALSGGPLAIPNPVRAMLAAVMTPAQ